ncbi:hypothetical protein [Streptomyces sp. NBC_00203]|uniref:hypothetical protein n=1 Tax=Streptomyces sp. NBC_00203 TaxID=2975680 RepID=UPI0032545BF9
MPRDAGRLPRQAGPQPAHIYVGRAGERRGEGLRSRLRRYTSGKALAHPGSARRCSTGRWPTPNGCLSAAGDLDKQVFDEVATLLKQIIDLRPVYHRLEERIRAHVVLCWLALLLTASPRPPPAALGRAFAANSNPSTSAPSPPTGRTSRS